ncbi:MAG TPA: hypothetical protein DCP19_00705 [Pseudomonas sp.]|nr:hypothetical protein [Pseudomonas sp.]
MAAYDFIINDANGRRILDRARFALRIIHRGVVTNPTGNFTTMTYDVPGDLGSRFMIWVQEDKAGYGIPAYRVDGRRVTLNMTGNMSALILAVSFG